MTTRFAVWVAVLGTLAAAPAVSSQQLASAAPQRGPRFLLASPKGHVPLDVSRVPILGRRFSLDLDGVTRKTALSAIVRQTGLKLVYGDDLLGLDEQVRLRAEHITVAAALTDILWDANVDVVFGTGQQAVLVRRTAKASPSAGEIIGRVTDAKTGSGVARAEVLLEKTRWSTATDTNGHYRLAGVEPGDYTLIVRRPGYARQDRAVSVASGRTDTVNVTLEPVATRLSDLVTTATGRQRRLELANDITTINADSVVRMAPVSSVTELLENRVPGLVVQRTSGAPGDPARLRLRGASSPLRNNDPIVIVDGIRVYAEQSAARSGNLAGVGEGDANRFAAPSPLDYIDPNSIETIEVFKGPSAATLYGQDAANGVIVITTKKGKAGPTRWNATVDRGETRMSSSYPVPLFRWGHLRGTSDPIHCPRSGIVVLSAVPRQEGGCDADSVSAFQLLNDPELTILDKGSHTALSLGASGGNSVITYSVTGQYQDQLGLVKLPDYEADNYSARVGMAVPDWMKRPQRLKFWSVTNSGAVRLSSSMDLSMQVGLSRTAQQRSTLENNIGQLSTTYFDRASGTYYGFSSSAFSSVSSTQSQPLDYYTRATDGATALTSGLGLTWRARRWLTLTSNAGINYIQRAGEVLTPRGAASDTSVGGVAFAKGTSLITTVAARANATVPLKVGFQFRFVAGIDYADRLIDDQAVQSVNLPSGTTLIGSIVSANGVTRRREDNATFGWFAEPSIGNDRLNVSSGLRLDGGDAYGGGAKLPRFPKLGFSYVVSEEPFFPLKRLFSSLRLRVAFGKASRQPGPADHLRLYSTPQQTWVDGQLVTGQQVQTLGNTDLRPEQNTELEGGLDADLLDGRITASITGYRKTTEDALIDVPLAPSIYGHNLSMLQNIGVIRNTGLEMTIGAQLIRSQQLTWGTQLSVSQNRNIVLELGAGKQPFYTGARNSADGVTSGGTRVAAGYPLFGHWALPIIGYADGNENGVLEASEVVLGDTAVYVGQSLPNYTANLSTTVSLWRGAISITGGFDYQDGLSQYNMSSQRFAPFSAGAVDPGASLAEQIATIYVPRTDYNWFQTVSALRFNAMTVQYRMPSSLARRVGAQQLAVMIQGQNLGLWSNYRGLDPNVNRFATGNRVADNGVLPQPRTWQLRVSATY